MAVHYFLKWEDEWYEMEKSDGGIDKYGSVGNAFLLSGLPLLNNEMFLIALNGEPLLYKGDNTATLDADALLEAGLGQVLRDTVVDLEMDGKIVNVVTSDIVAGLSYAYLYEKMGFWDNVAQILQMLLVFVVLFFLVGGIYMFFAYRKLYIPINNLVSNIRRYIDFESYDEVETIQRAFSNVQNANKVLWDNLADTLFTYVEKGDIDKVKMLLDQVFKKNLTYEHISASEQMDLKLTLISVINKLLTDKNEDFGTVFQEEAVHLMAIEDVDTFMDRMIDVFVTVTKRLSIPSHAGMMQNIIQYIQEHYTEDIALADVAEYFGISTGYVGKLFRENMDGITFRDYLNQFRIEKAKALIVEKKEIKINEIAGMVGFLNVTTFIRVFKRYEDITPGEYRAKQL